MSEYRRNPIRHIIENWYWRRMSKPVETPAVNQPDDMRSMVMEVRTPTGWKVIPVKKD